MADLFSWMEGGRLRDEGMAAAASAQEGADPGWGDRAYAALEALALVRPELHVNDLAEVFTEQPAHYNAWGSVWTKAIKRKIIVHSGRVKHCLSATKHRHQSPIYTSLIYCRNGE